jgi:hypothetical protein
MKDVAVLKMSALEVAFFLVAIPLAFSFAVHYVSSKNDSFATKREVQIVAGLGTVEAFLANTEKMKTVLPFYSPDNRYKKSSLNSEVYNYSFPLLGQQEVKIVKSKEETRYLSQEDKLHVVGAIHLSSDTTFCWTSSS